MNVNTSGDIRNWYVTARPSYTALADVVRNTVEGLLKGAAIEHLSVTARAKTLESFSEKIERKGYSDPATQMTDLAGIRVITFIERDVNRACDLIRSSFHVYPDRSLDKSDELEVDRFGYRSVHFVCDLGKDRLKLPEYKIYKGMLFEVQVRTVLQHAWAEIEHDRSYKFSAGLPTQLRRRLFLIAGSLELADREFNQIATELDAYALEISKKTERGEFNVELNATSVRGYLNSKFKGKKTILEQSDALGLIIPELRRYGIQSLSDLDALIGDDLLIDMETKRSRVTELGVLRAAMLFNNIDQYFNEAWRNSWKGLSKGTHEMLVHRYGQRKTNQVLRKYKIDLPDPEDAE